MSKFCGDAKLLYLWRLDVVTIMLTLLYKKMSNYETSNTNPLQK
jgi:hypothetical protein